jgi:hypothetical protein
MTDTASRGGNTLNEGGIAGGAVYILRAVSSCLCLRVDEKNGLQRYKCVPGGACANGSLHSRPGVLPGDRARR